MENEIVSKTGFCYGLDSHSGVLVNGDVIPSRLDQNACVKLGPTNSTQLDDILNSKRVKDIQKGF